ncbi:type II toxin-antitoxin system HipA family toxin [Sansalvadorimonas verongulae]|nr:type II toxin-antitoxin system HipA family toxin [Sansalvadorimonas verongulae]
MISLPESISRIGVSVHTNPAGLLTHGASYNFLYQADEWPISLSMPVQLEPYKSGAIFPVFSQNLPEGYIRRYVSEKLRRYAKVNDMYLLALQGQDGIGLLGYDAGFELPPLEKVSISDIVGWDEPEDIFPQLLDRFYLRGMLSGVQPKVLIPQASRSTTPQQDIIVKTGDAEFPSLAINEYVCMESARACGLEPPRCYLSNNHEVFIVERFDRVDGIQWGMEDFTTLMGRASEEKYNSSYEMVMKVVQKYVVSPKETEKAFRYIVHSLLIGNGDAHLKNFALQYDPDMGNLRLSPPYDITHTLIYPTIDNQMALKLRKSKEFPTRRELIRLGDEYSVTKPGAIIDEMSETLNTFLTDSDEVELMDGLKASMLGAISQVHARADSAKGFRHTKNRRSLR